VVADADDEARPAPAPIQYRRFAEPATPLQKALHRARRIAPANRILVTAAEAHRSHWQSALWFIPSEHRFVSESPGWSSLTTAAAVLAIAARVPSAAVTILPARCYVDDEWTLTLALHTALSNMAHAADGVITLGMAGGASEVDEDYLLLDAAPDGGPMAPVSVTARRPLDWVARRLADRGALVASGIFMGHADALAAVLYKYWPKPTHQLLRHLARSFAAGVENRLPAAVVEEARRAAPQSFWKHPPWLPLRALRVAHCGWSSLRSERAIEQLLTPAQATPPGRPPAPGSARYAAEAFRELSRSARWPRTRRRSQTAPAWPEVES